MPTDIQIAQAAVPKSIEEIAQSISVPKEALFPIGSHMAKINPTKISNKKQGHLILVSAISPTPAGEGKTTVSIGLADGLRCIGKNSMLALREPSLGPVFGMKGGAAGGGYSQVIPMEDINLHFTGDFHAITSANNLLAAIVDNHIYQGNALSIQQVVWRRCLDVNDRQLRHIIDGVGGKTNGVIREDGFDITTASEIMATFCLASDFEDLRLRLDRLVVGYTSDKTAITAKDLKATGSMLALLQRAFWPNLVQSLAHTPALVHGGPFANIAHGCNSVIATKTALNLADYVVTEAGFGADLGAEKFLDIKCRSAGISPDAVVIVATIRALKSHGGVSKENLNLENIEAVRRGIPNLLRHVTNIQNVYNLPVVVAINRFSTDTMGEISTIHHACDQSNIRSVSCDVWAKGGEGAVDLAQEVVELCEQQSEISFAYDVNLSYQEKISAIAKKIYHANHVEFSKQAIAQIQEYDEQYPNWPVCIAKTQYSFSDDPKKLAAPIDFNLHIRNVRLSSGAGFVVAFAGDIISMPGLPKVPAAEHINVDKDDQITGLS